MSPTGPFIDSETGGLDTNQILAEAYPLVGLILLFAVLAILPSIFTILLAGNSFIGFLFTLLTQLILAIGAGIVLIYIIARAMQLADM